MGNKMLAILLTVIMIGIATCCGKAVTPVDDTSETVNVAEASSETAAIATDTRYHMLSTAILLPEKRRLLLH